MWTPRYWWASSCLRHRIFCGACFLSVTVNCGPVCGAVFAMLGHPAESKCQLKYNQVHFAGFSSPPLACKMPCHILRFHCTIGTGFEFEFASIAMIILVSSTKASNPCWSCCWWFRDVSVQGAAIDWYTQIMLSAWTTHCNAASPSPWPAPYHGDSGVKVLYWDEMPCMCLMWYLNWLWAATYCQADRLCCHHQASHFHGSYYLFKGAWV